MLIDSMEITVCGRLLKTAKLRDEHYEFVEEPVRFVEKVKQVRSADIFTFTQRISKSEPEYHYHLEWDELAVLKLNSYDDWWKEGISGKTRNMIRKSQKCGVELRLVEFNDELIKGIVEIYNECPLRQGKVFKHYGKDFKAIKADHESFLSRSDFIGAFYQDRLIGFIKLVHGPDSSSLMQIISRIADRDKAPTNSLLAKAVEVCTQKKVPLLHYGIWSKRGLGEFKKHHGFEPVRIPRYYVPLSWKGRMILGLKLHRPIADYLPETCVETLSSWRSRWHAFKYSNGTT